jgi:hypothetical protein
VNISRITTATSVAIQSSELTAVSATSIDDTLLSENVQTFAGQATLSRQAIERGTAVEEVTLAWIPTLGGSVNTAVAGWSAE